MSALLVVPQVNDGARSKEGDEAGSARTAMEQLEHMVAAPSPTVQNLLQILKYSFYPRF